MTQQSHQDNPDSARIKPPAQAANKAARTVKKPRKITETYLHNAGLYYLQRFAASTTQFRRIMQRKIDKSCAAYPEQNSEECRTFLDNVVATFQRTGLLNDDIYATSAIRSLRQRGLSKRAIETKMAIKGIPVPQVKKILAEIDELSENDPDMVAALKHARKRRIGPWLSPEKKNMDGLQDRHMAAMGRNGFDYQTARKALQMSKEEAEDIIIGSSGW